jgi:ribosomal protein L17
MIISKFPPNHNFLDYLPNSTKRNQYFGLFSVEYEKLFHGSLANETAAVHSPPAESLFGEEEQEALPQIKKRVRDLHASGTLFENDSKRAATTKLDELSKSMEKKVLTKAMPPPSNTRTSAARPFKNDQLNTLFAEICKNHQNGALGLTPDCFHKQSTVPQLTEREAELIQWFYSK